MRIGIDARVLGTSRALDRYTRNLIANLVKVDRGNEYVLFVDKAAKNVFGLESVVVPPKLTWRDHLAMAAAVKKSGIDFFFHPDNIEFLRMPVPSAVTIHDLIPYKFPNLVFSKRPWLRLRQQVYFQMQKQAIRRNTDLILTVSENTKRDVCALFKIPAHRVKVVYEGVEENFTPIRNKAKIKRVLGKYKVDVPYIFYIGGLGRHKNVGSLIAAFGEVVKKSPRKDLKLAIGGQTAGDTSSGQNEYQNLVAQIKRLKLSRRVTFTGFVAEEDLPVLYSGAEVFVYPSLYEGFGFPPLEALACGCPVVCSNAASLPEVVGGTGRLVNPQVGDLAAVIEEILSMDAQSRERLVKQGLKQAEKFSWEKCARETASALADLS